MPASKKKLPLAAEPLALLRLEAVLARTGLSRSAIYRLLTAGEFPQGILVAGTSVKAWPSTVVAAWVARQIEEAA
jgi:prophage regulatory protein